MEVRATGIIRKIDDLGRIVIPKEIRKSLRVKEGMPLEIYVDKTGGIILRKFLPFADVISLAAEYAECMMRQTGAAVAITDREKVIAAGGFPGRRLPGKKVSAKLERIMDDRDEALPESERAGFIPVTEGMEASGDQIVKLIRRDGEIIGAVFLQSRDEKGKMGEPEQKIAAIAAEFLGRQVSG